jgi:hypothetical protein
MLDTMIMPIALLAVGALSCLAISRMASSGQSQQPAEVPAPSAVPDTVG